jgi:type VI secretion system protein ImpC
MAETQPVQPQLARRAFEGTTSPRCCNKEFKPKTDEAKSAVEQAVQTLAQQALAQTS